MEGIIFLQRHPIAGECAANAVHEGQCFRLIGQIDAQFLFFALDGEDVLVQQQGFDFRYQCPFFQSVGRGVGHFATGNDRLIEQGDESLFNESGFATLVFGEVIHQLADIEGGTGWQGNGEQQEPAEKSFDHFFWLGICNFNLHNFSSEKRTTVAKAGTCSDKN